MSVTILRCISTSVDESVDESARLDLQSCYNKQILYHHITQTPNELSSKPPIHLVHGFPDVFSTKLMTDWHQQISPLIEPDHWVIVPSTMGYYENKSPLPHEYYTFKLHATAR